MFRLGISTEYPENKGGGGVGDGVGRGEALVVLVKKFLVLYQNILWLYKKTKQVVQK